MQRSCYGTGPRSLIMNKLTRHFGIAKWASTLAACNIPRTPEHMALKSLGRTSAALTCNLCMEPQWAWPVKNGLAASRVLATTVGCVPTDRRDKTLKILVWKLGLPRRGMGGSRDLKKKKKARWEADYKKCFSPNWTLEKIVFQHVAS